MDFITSLVFYLWMNTAAVYSTDVQVWLTTIDQKNLLSRKEDVQFIERSFAGVNVIDINSSLTFQTIDGFGASLTESSAYLISEKMTQKQRIKLLKKLFTSSEGIGLNFLRQPMGSSDFALGNYNYDDTCCDTKDFSIARDKKYIIPLLKQIQKLNPNLLVMGNPWSPPGWMKTSGSMLGGSLRTEYYGQLAEYFVKYVQAYHKEGIEIYGVTVQNEPQHVFETFPGMHMTANEQSQFIKRNLGPQFRKNNLKTKIMILDDTWSVTQFARQVLNDSEANAYINGTAFHCYSGSPQAQNFLHNEYPLKDIWMTECSSSIKSMTNASESLFESILRNIVNTLIIGSVGNWGRGVIKWNLALDENNGPQNGGCVDCLGTVTINQSNGQVTYGADYYGLGHASKFVQKGATRIYSTSLESYGINNVALKNPDRSIVFIAFNTKNSQLQFNVRWKNKTFMYNLPSKAAVTFMWK